MFAMPLPNHVEHRIKKRYLELYVTLNIEKIEYKTNKWLLFSEILLSKMIKTIDKKYDTKKLSQYKVSAFIDKSGSTCSKFSGSTLLEREIELAKKVVNGSSNMVYWSTQVSFNPKVYPDGGTSPNCIFYDHTSKKLFDSSEIILFFTDGEISQRDVTSFSNELKNRMSKALYICVIVNKNFEDLSSLDISVIAPMMFASNVLCLYHNAQKNKNVVIAAKGDISKYYPNPTKMKFNDLQEVNFENLLDLQVSSSQNLPTNCIIVSETNKSYKLVDINVLHNHDGSILELDEEEWINLIKYSLVSNNLQKLRHTITKSQSAELEKLQNELRTNFPLHNIKKRDQIVENMTLAYLSGNSEEQNRLKQDLDAVKDSARKEEVEWMKFLKEKMDEAKKKWNVIRNMIYNIEKDNNKYSLNNFSFASNRASRANNVETDKLEEYENTICYDGCPEIDCTIHLDKGPCVLWLQKYDDIEYTTNDFCLNYPLSTYPKLKKILVSNPVCGECASAYLRHTNKSVYREDISAYIPLNWNYSQNVKFSEGMLCQTLCENKLLPHVKMLLLSVVDDFENVEWFEPYRQYFRDQLINNIYTTTTFSEEGQKVPLIEALKCITKDESNMLRQSFQAAMRILKLSSEKSNNSADIIAMTQKRFAYLLVELYSSFVKNNGNLNVNDNIVRILYENLCGVPIENKNRNVTLEDESFLKFIMDEKNNFVPSLNKIFNILGKNMADYISDKFIANVLWNLSRQTIHERPLVVYTNLMHNEKVFRELNDVSDIYEQMNKEKFGGYKKVDNYDFPEFAFYNGEYSCPSKLFFRETPLWTNDMDNQTFDISALSEIFKLKLQNRMEKYFGSYYPTHNSAHIMLHRTVSKIIENKYQHENEMTDDIVIDCIKALAETRGNYGNIYSEDTLGSIINAGNDFFRIKRMTNYATGNREIDQSNSHKLKSELLSYGMQFDGDNVLFKIELIKKPSLISSWISDQDKLVARINKKFENKK